MPKLKTKKGAAKRFRFTKKGKIKRKKASLRHNLTGKSSKRKRNLRKSGIVTTEVKAVKKMLPYGGR